MKELIRYNKYSREDIHDIFSPDTKFTPGAGYWGISGIIKVPNTLHDYIFLVTYGQKQAEHEFDENIDENGILTWQSQPKQDLSTPQIIEFINHDYKTDNIYLFLRNNKKSDYTYLGLLAYVEHDTKKEKPVYFKWRILDWNEEEGRKKIKDMPQTRGLNNKEFEIKLRESDGANYTTNSNNMNQKIDKEVLEYMDIHKTKEAIPEKVELGLKIKKDITKLTNFNIEKVYIIDKYAWGESDERPAFCFLTDVRIRDINEKFKLIEDYAYKNNVNILVWSMCQFEKRRNNPTEFDYYIYNYGIKIYDSEKLVEIDENVKATEYASKMDLHRYLYEYRKNNPEALMQDLLQIYALKMNYPINDNKKLESTIKYIKHISQDKTILKALEEFRKEDVDRLKICKKLEKYIKELKQIRVKMELDNPPTMKVYERLLDTKNKEGKVSISNLTKENLYTMDVIQDKSKDDIVKLFDIDEKEFDKIRKKYGFKIIDSIWYNDMDELIAKAVDKNVDHAYQILKDMGVLNFQKHTYDILKYIKDGQKYLLKEFWKFTNGKREGLELNYANTAKDVYFRAYLSAELLKQNGFIEEVEYLTYRITSKGKELLERLEYSNVEELNMIEICNIFGEANFYALCIIKLNNGELLFYGDEEQIEKYRNEREEQSIAEEVKLNENEEIEVEEVKFEEVLVKNNSKSREKSEGKRTKADYQKINISKEKIGKDSEKIVYDLEKERLAKEGRKDLSQSVIWESEENGDGAGYDIRSYEKKNEKYIEIYIEVKGTNKSINEPFDISKNEIEASNRYKKQYYIYRIGNIYTNKPKFYKINGRIEDNFTLEATNFKARKK